MTTYRFVEGMTGNITEVGTVESTWYYVQTANEAYGAPPNYFKAETDEEKANAEGMVGCKRITREEYEQHTNG